MCIGFGGQLFRQMVGVPIGVGCAPLLADLFLYSCGSGFLDKLIGGEQGRACWKVRSVVSLY